MLTNLHISALQLDALALGVLDGDTAAQVRAHLASCARCRRDQAAAAELRAHFTMRIAPRGLAARWPPRWLWLAIPVLGVVCLFLALRPSASAIPEYAAKGDAAWQVFANRDGETFVVHDGEVLAPGDRIQFVVLPGGPRYLLVASVDGSGAATIYYPYGGARSAPTDGQWVEPADSIVLDHAPGPERIYALISDEPLPADAVTAQLRVIAARGADAIRNTRTLPISARVQLSLVFEKEVP